MLYLSYSQLWTFSIFCYISYIIFIFSLIVYLIPLTGNYNEVNSSNSLFKCINSLHMWWIGVIPILLLGSMLSYWVSPVITAWFGHIIFSSFQLNTLHLILFNFGLIITLFNLTSYFSSREIFDYTIVIYNFLYWVILLFTVNTTFTFIFIIEVMATLIFLLITTSVFSTTYFYNNLHFNFGHVFQQVNPSLFIQSILYLFWVSLVASLNLFFFLIMFYTKIFTFDWYIIEYIFLHWTVGVNKLDTLVTTLIWFIFLLSIFLNCGIAPLYIWNPTFFNGLPLHTLVFYVFFFYFHLYIFLLYFFSLYLTEVFYFFIIIMWYIIFLGVLLLLTFICETFYLNSFIAVSSILNSLLVFLAFSVPHYTNFFIYI